MSSSSMPERAASTWDETVALSWALLTCKGERQTHPESANQLQGFLFCCCDWLTGIK